MGFQFTETMRGSVVWAWAPLERRPFQFELTVHAPSLPRHLIDGRATASGTLTAQPLAERVPVSGALTVRPLCERVIRYHLAFVGGDGARYELVGQKDIRWLAPRVTLTHLPCEIRDEQHRRAATCEATFDLRRDSWSFLRSFQLWPR